MSFLRSREIPIGITLIMGFLMLIDYYFKAEIPQVAATSTIVQRWAVIIAAFALLIGLINITRIHVNHLMKRTRGQWIFSIWCLFIMYLMIIVGLVGTVRHPIYQWLYTNVFLPIDAAMYSILALFISSAAYRAFRARNFEAFLMLASGIITMMMNAPIGEIIWKGFPLVGDWIMMVPNVAAQRAFLICVVVGTVSLGIRTLLGMERGYLGREE
ncbi:MAG: hypothetical protein QXD04_02500 [Candidatus Bathyarchaeia archaeon]|nr:hypothetical protein [Candidatus Bathyarchaeota archaeon]